eukprot:Nitzschia sp. Nitz4//scaffold111_size72815//42428//43594//NITZ4_005792-RA/size72815-processed-gene-0.55-mRNA-1//1//CDS//3329533186//1044//frame0
MIGKIVELKLARFWIEAVSRWYTLCVEAYGRCSGQRRERRVVETDERAPSPAESVCLAASTVVVQYCSSLCEVIEKMTFNSVVARGMRQAGAVLREQGGAEIFSRHRPVMTFLGITPFVTNDTFIAPTASVIGEVTNWDRSSVWYGAVVKADSSHPITIGFNSSIGEGSVVTTLPKNATLATGFPPICHIGHYVTVGANSVLKSCRVDDLVVIGEKCTILEGAMIEANVILEPGTVVPPYARITPGKWAGNPAAFVGPLDPDEENNIKRTSVEIQEKAKEHLTEFLPVGYTYVQLEELERQHADVKQG